MKFSLSPGNNQFYSESTVNNRFSQEAVKEELPVNNQLETVQEEVWAEDSRPPALPPKTAKKSFVIKGIPR